MTLRIFVLTVMMTASLVAFGAPAETIQIAEPAQASCIMDPLDGGCVSLPCIETPEGKTCVPCEIEISKYVVAACLM
ncbi:MAG: hypothetical protein KY455_01635 [Euryarchaeota archaeon]|nr:hypothetical protein [Euryarchaeota archaeon]